MSTGHHGWLGQCGTSSVAEAAGSSTRREQMRGSRRHGALIQLRSPIQLTENASTASHPWSRRRRSWREYDPEYGGAGKFAPGFGQR